MYDSVFPRPINAWPSSYVGGWYARTVYYFAEGFRVTDGAKSKGYCHSYSCHPHTGITTHSLGVLTHPFASLRDNTMIDTYLTYYFAYFVHILRSSLAWNRLAPSNERNDLSCSSVCLSKRSKEGCGRHTLIGSVIHHYYCTSKSP